MVRDVDHRGANQDPTSAVTLAARAWQAWTRGQEASAQTFAQAAKVAVRHRPRKDRQQVQVVALAVIGDLDRASGLASEHLAEFPGDELIHQVQAWAAGRRRGI
jgi:hypothetical protein